MGTQLRRSMSALVVTAALGLGVVQCGGPESFKRQLAATGAGGASGGAGAAGRAGADGGLPAAGGAAGLGAAGADPTGLAGAGGGAGAMGGAGAAGAGGGGGKAGAGVDGGAGGKGGGAGGAAAGAGGAPRDAAADVPAGCACAVKVQYECRQNGPSVAVAEFSLKVVNVGTQPLALNTVSVRYWYTVDGTGAQSGTCASTAYPCAVAFQAAAPTRPTADQYAVVTFTGGTLAPGASTDEIQIAMHGTGNYDQTDDFSFANTGAVYMDSMDVTGYVSGKLSWGAPP